MTEPESPPLLGLATVLAFGLLIAWLGGVVAVHRALTRPPRRTYASAVSRGRAGDPGELDPPRRFETWSLSTRGLSLPVWDLPGDDPSGPVTILSHGWGDSRVGGLQRLPLVVECSSRVVLWDMPGHGEAPGRSTLGTLEVADLIALVERLREPHRGIVLYGWSLGAGVSIATAARFATHTESPRLAAVVAEAPYRLPVTPAQRMLAALKWPAFGLARPALLAASLAAPELRSPATFDRARYAGQMRCPLLVLHGGEDEICPSRDGAEIAEAAGASGVTAAIEIFPDASHNDLWQSEDRLARAREIVRAFVARSHH